MGTSAASESVAVTHPSPGLAPGLESEPASAPCPGLRVWLCELTGRLACAVGCVCFHELLCAGLRDWMGLLLGGTGKSGYLDLSKGLG